MDIKLKPCAKPCTRGKRIEKRIAHATRQNAPIELTARLFKARMRYKLFTHTLKKLILSFATFQISALMTGTSFKVSATNLTLNGMSPFVTRFKFAKDWMRKSS